MCGTHNRKHTETFIPITNFMRWGVVVARVRITLAISLLIFFIAVRHIASDVYTRKSVRAVGAFTERDLNTIWQCRAYPFSFHSLCVCSACAGNLERASFTKVCAAAITHLSDKFYWIFDCGSLVLDQASIYDGDVHSIMTSHLV